MNEVSAQSRRSRLSGHSVGIPPRHIDFNFAPNTPRYFFANNATATLFFAMLSGFFPPGERYFMESVRHFRERITDERLRAAIAGRSFNHSPTRVMALLPSLARARFPGAT